MSFPYSTLTDIDRHTMLQTIGVDSADAFFKEIPEALRMNGDLNIPGPLNEWQLATHLRQLAEKNASVYSHQNYLGGGYYQHHIPAVVESIVSRGEFNTAYTPYQPEMSQGLLQAIYEYQQKMSKITGLPLTNGSNYDGSTAMAEGAWMLCRKANKKRILVAASIWQQYRDVLETYMWGRDVVIDVVPHDKETGKIDTVALKHLVAQQEVAGLVFQSPNAFGVIEDIQRVAQICKDNQIASLVSYNPMLSGVCDPPGKLGVDVVTGEGQVFGIPLNFGGPGLGVFSAAEQYRNYLPGRIVGIRKNRWNKACFALIHESREQHVARENATSNICSNQALNALRACVYLACVGENGLGDIARSNLSNAHYLCTQLCHIPGVDRTFNGEFFNEFLLTLDVPVDKLLCQLQQNGFFAGIEVLVNNQQALLVAVTEVKSIAELDAFVAQFKNAMHSMAGNNSCPQEIKEENSTDAAAILPANAVEHLLCSDYARKAPLGFDDLPEVEVVRHFTNMSKNSFGVDNGTYPLGSCTMKYNPRRNEKCADLDGFTGLHPMQPVDSVPGLSQLLLDCESHLCELTGMQAASFQPAAGAHGELAGLLIIRKYFEQKQQNRNVVLIADSAHGTNPASAAMAGFECKIIKTNSSGTMDMQALSQELNDRVAALIITNPSTLGLFDTNILEIANSVHEAGGLLYYDGANLNALMGVVRPGDMGFDVMHINTHKTLSTPHGGGGPGSGPVLVKGFLSDYLPQGRIIASGGTYQLSHNSQLSIGRIKAFYGHINIVIKAYCYLITMGGAGLKQATLDAVLNANYIQSQLSDVFPPVYEKLCMHECLLHFNSDAMELSQFAEELIRENIHPPTIVGAGCVYFPQELSSAILLEPTETETKQNLDRMVSTMKKILVQNAWKYEFNSGQMAATEMLDTNELA